MSNYRVGHYAEKQAAEYLKTKGFKVLELNWQTRWCEIDIVAEKEKAIYFIEVKYRQNSSYGRGLDYITSKKLKSMAFAAEYWVAQKKWVGDYNLSAVELSGPNYEVTSFLPEL